MTFRDASWFYIDKVKHFFISIYAKLSYQPATYKPLTHKTCIFLFCFFIRKTACYYISRLQFQRPRPFLFLIKEGNIFGSATKDSYCMLVTSLYFNMEGHMKRLKRGRGGGKLQLRLQYLVVNLAVPVSTCPAW